jgi:CHAD domain-containing protein
MPRFQKWLLGDLPDAPADEVARAALAERLLAVVHFLDKAIGDADEAESIHQLRVWTRRAATALKLFAPAISDARRKKMQKTLRKLRRRAGDVRDCDVYLDRLEHERIAPPKRVVRLLKQQRRLARRRLKALRRRLRHNDHLELRVERLLEAIAWPKRHSSRQPPPYGKFCKQQLAPLAAEFFDLAGQDLKNDDTLHALRIAGKRLRYALELAAAVMPARIHQRLYDSLDEVQDRLGEVVDQLAAIARVRQWREAMDKKQQRQKLRNLLAREETRLGQKRTRLFRWWSAKRRAGLRKLWQHAVSK